MMKYKTTYTLLFFSVIVIGWTLLSKEKCAMEHTDHKVKDNTVFRSDSSELICDDDSLYPTVTIGKNEDRSVYTFYYKRNKLYRKANCTREILSVLLTKNDNEDIVEPYSILFGTLSEDGQSIFIVIDTGNCGRGGAFDGQELYKINIQTLQSKCLVEANEISIYAKGFRVRKLSLKREGDCTANDEYAESFIYYNMNGEKLSK